MCPLASAFTPGLRRGPALDRSLQAGSLHVPVQVRLGAGPTDELPLAVRRTGADRIVVLSEASLPEAHIGRVLRLVEAVAPAEVRRLPATPRDTAEAGVVPDGAAVVALGGGRVLRAADRLARPDGTRPPLLRLPTTLRAMSGAALSVAGLADPVAGPRPAPVLVLEWLDFLDTLDTGALRAGVCAVVRDVLAVVPGSYDQVAGRLLHDGRYDPETVAGFLSLCLEVRAALLAYDPLETGPAEALHYGRALTRALRAAARPGTLPHGADALLGLLVAARAARLSGLLDASGELAHAELVERAGGPSALPPGTAVEDVLAALLRGSAGLRPPRQRAAGTGTDRVRLVLLDGLGAPHLERGRALTPVGTGILRAALGAFVPGHGPGPGQGPGQDRALMPLGRQAPESR
ncbi:3-dehydroquinate synthase family protein [Streptomyces tanashiensis]|uniref:3-dehydroquinate synthase family protein n=1 Tax=Streptomyces tanashiensis TaxID=67367 RepID=UPI00344A4E9D